MGRYVHSTLTLFVFFTCFKLGLSQLPVDQVSTMNRVYDILQNTTDSYFVWRSISRESNPCSWTGVSCSSDNSSVTELSFSSLSISSSEFLPVICQIGSLVSIDVSNNHLTSIPTGFFTVCGEISGLRVLNFSRNSLSGTLPTFLNGFRMLEILDISYNLITGGISSQLEGLDSLRSLNLSRNQFTGNIPINLGRMGLLEELQLSFNGFGNEIPREITRYRNLTLVDLSFNGLSGSIPQDFGQLTKVEILVLSLNNLTGSIPNSVSNITTLLRFAANQNHFNGTIPLGITAYLRSLDLSYNNLTGTIPSDLLSSTNLQALDLSNNKLEGSIPSNISTSLIRLRLRSNSLNGALPFTSLQSRMELTYLELDNNLLTGTIPWELSVCKNLALLNLAQNDLTGRLPSSLGNLTNLQVLNLQFNHFSGEIPTEITLLNRLERLNFSRNLLSGPIPISITSLRNLTHLDLQGNNLSGQIPNSIGSLSNLIELQLGNNQLNGNVPDMPQSLQISLNLSHNHLSGLIPVTLSQLNALEVLDLSNNRFSGEIPNSLTGMPGLTRLVLSNNQLTGIVPRFESYVTVETNGNNVSMIPAENPTPASQKRGRSLAVNFIIAFASAAAAVGLFVMICLFISRRYYRINDEYVHSEQETSPTVIRGNILTPNSIHRSNIDFTKAMEAVADPSNIILQTRFSTYYKSVMPSGASYFVKKLNWSDKIFQSGSHERFGEELEVLGKLCNSNVMIPLAYVLTVDSAFLFYNFLPEGALSDIVHTNTIHTLDWSNRYSIALGIAQGLAFLHGYSSGPILLLDLSSKSILLKSLNEPLIGDIELCKVIDPSKNTGSLSTVAGSVGYIPPEYAYTMRVTAAGNVYSFGIVLLELLTGKPAVNGGIELAKWVLSNNMQQNKLDKILDYSVSKASVAVRSQMLAVLKVALACVSVSQGARPNMKSVLRMLLNAR